jgi:hypothetical protein
MDMFTALSPEFRARDLAAQLNLRNDFVAALCGITPTKLSSAFRGVAELKNEQSKRLVNTLLRIAELQTALFPLSLDMRNPKACQDVLEAFEGLDAATIRARVDVLFRVVNS